MSDGDESAFWFAPVTPPTRADLERLSRAYGKFRYCSFLRWRLRSAAIAAAKTIPSLPGAGVWAVTCFFLAPRVRRTGLQPRLLTAACDYARTFGAEIIEAYPWPGGSSYRYMGTRELYAAAGFTDVPGPRGGRPVMRYAVPR